MISGQVLGITIELKWSNGDSLDVFNKIFTDKQNYNSMVNWLKNSIKLLPTSNAMVLIYCTLTGLRAGEAFKSIKLIQNQKLNYLNEKLMILEHFKYPSDFLRRTKKAYISIVTNDILEIAD